MNKDSSVLDSLMLRLMDKSETSIYQILPKAYMVLNLRGSILGYNSKCKELIDLIKSEGEIKNINNFLLGRNKERFKTMIEYVRLKGNIDDFELEISKPGGQIMIIWISASAIYDSNKNTIAFHCLMSDMTKEQMFLTQMKEELRTHCDSC